MQTGSLDELSVQDAPFWHGLFNTHKDDVSFDPAENSKAKLSLIFNLLKFIEFFFTYYLFGNNFQCMKL